MRKVTLTFDNGPDPAITPYVLDCLARHKIQTTFFVMGKKVVLPENQAVAKRARDAGHRIGNHTFTHSVPLGELDAEGALDEFDRAERALDWLEQPVRLFRPYGRGGMLGPHLLHPALVDRLLTDAYTCVLWKAIAGDWKNPETWVEKALDDCRDAAWSLVVLHDIPSGAMRRLDEFLKRLESEGVEFAQDYPPDCVPVAGGKLLLPIEAWCAPSH